MVKDSLVDNLILQPLLHLGATHQPTSTIDHLVGKRGCIIKLSTREPFYHFMSAGVTEKPRPLLMCIKFYRSLKGVVYIGDRHC